MNKTVLHHLFHLPCPLVRFVDACKSSAFVRCGIALLFSLGVAVQAVEPGTLVGWGGGENSRFQLAYPPGLTNVIAVASSDFIGTAVKSDGTVAAWGLNQYGRTDVPPGLTGVKAVAAGSFHVLALKSDGTVVGWGAGTTNGGYPHFGQAKPPEGLANVTAVACGDLTSLALRSDGTVVAWGDNSRGETNVPAGLANVVAITTFYTASIALKSDGTLVLWGRDLYGLSSELAALKGIKAVSGGGFHVAALKNDGTVVVLGDNSYHQREVPPGLSNVVLIAAGYAHTAVLKSDGTVSAFGKTKDGEANPPACLDNVFALDAGHTGSGTFAIGRLSTLPQTIQFGALPTVKVGDDPLTLTATASSGLPVTYASSNPNVATVSKGVLTFHFPGTTVITASQPGDTCVQEAPSVSRTLTVGVAGLLEAWGNNDDGETGVPPALGIITAISASRDGGYPYNLVLKKDGTVAAFPFNANTPASVPKGLNNVAAIEAASAEFALALKNNGSVVQWPDFSSMAPPPAGLTNVIAVSANDRSALALRSDGTVAAWGFRNAGVTMAANIISTAASLSGVTAVAAGTRHALVLKSDGTVFAWGDNDVEQTNVPAGLSNVVAVAAGFVHSVALKSDGTVVSWGYLQSQFPPPADLHDVIAISAGSYHTLALRKDGTVVGWGSNDYGQLSIPAGLANIAAVSAGFKHSLALRAVAPPKITSQPAPLDLGLNATANFTVAALGAAPLQYQWRHEGTNISGGADGTLSFTVTDAVQAGNYSVVVSNLAGSAVSSNALLTLHVPQTITFGPVANQKKGTAPFALPPTASSGLPVVYTSSNPRVASVVGNQLRMYGKGTTVITATQPGNYAYNPATPVSQTLTVEANSGRVVGWGRDSFGMISSIPADLTNAVEVATGDSHTMALREDGTLVVWGYTDPGVGNIPAGATNIVSIGVGTRFSVATSADGKVFAWGENIFGVTVVPPEATNVVSIAAGYYHVTTLRADGTVVSWGNNTFKQVNVPAGLGGVVAIGVGAYSNFAVKSDGGIVTWGFNSSGFRGVAEGLTDSVSLAFGYNFGSALKPDGTVVSFGSNGYGESTVPPGLSNVIAIACGENHTLALKGDGTVVAWGAGLVNTPADAANFGQSLVPAGLTNVVSIAAGVGQSYAIVPNVISQAPQVTVTFAGAGGAACAPPGQFGFSMGGANGLAIVVEVCADLSKPVWTPISTNVIAGGTSCFADPLTATRPKAFYRFRAQ